MGLHPAAALGAALIYIAFAVSLSSLPPLALAGVLAGLGAWWLSGSVRPWRQALWVMPVGAAMALLVTLVAPGGWDRAGVLLLRLWTAAVLLAALRARFGTLGILEALSGLALPGLLVQLIGFTLRYTETLAAESRRMLLARRSRAFAVRRRLFDRHAVATYGQLLGILFVRARERSERVYLAMLSRGHRLQMSGARPPLLRGKPDWSVTGAALLSALLLKLWDWSW